MSVYFYHCIGDLINSPSYFIVKYPHLITFIHNMIMIYVIIYLIYFVIALTYTQDDHSDRRKRRLKRL